MPRSAVPTEVELAIELMPCQALRVAQEPGPAPHPCAYFRRWGTYHSFDYREPGPPKAGDQSRALYLGRAPLAPEMLSGCRKAPILAVGINPNLPGWWPNLHGSLNPWFDDIRQYAYYFRYRRTAKPELSASDYTAFGGGPKDVPPDSTLELHVPPDSHGQWIIDVHWRAQKMYEAYQSLLDDLASTMNWPSGLVVGEDLSYGNMVGCPSAKWTTRSDPNEPRLPAMTDVQREGIVGACFHERKYFLRQLFQSLPTIILVFSQNTARAFVGELQGRFSAGNPSPNDSIADLMTKAVVLHLGDRPDGTPIDARVIFGPHPTGDPEGWRDARPTVVKQLVDAAQGGRLRFNPATGHLARPVGACVFCTMLEIGPCDYLQELEPLVEPPAITAPGAIPEIADKREQERLLATFLAAGRRDETAWKNTDDPQSEGS